jgi:phosphate/sulfate permease
MAACQTCAAAFQVYAYGMVIALAAGFVWQAWASYVGFNVSATHSISECYVCCTVLNCLQNCLGHRMACTL